MKRLTRAQKKAQQKKLRKDTKKPGNSRYGLKVQARERFFRAGGTWKQWVINRTIQL